MRAFRRLQALSVRALVAASPLLFGGAALAATDKRAIAGATAEVGPSIPEPSSIFLFVAGVAIVGYGVHRHRRQG